MAKRLELDWNDVRYFLAAVRSRTLSGAARALGVKHSTIGRRLTALERSLGASLVIKRPDGLEPTQLGNKVMLLADEVERAMFGLQGLVDSEKKHIRLAAPSGFSKLFGEQIGRLHQQSPEISLEVLSGSRPVNLNKGEADLALRAGPVADQDLIVRKITKVGWSLYASEAYLQRRQPPVDPRELAGHELLGYHESLAAVPGAKWIEKYGANANIVLRTREMTEMLAAAVSGTGLAVLPCWLAESEPPMKRLTNDVLGTHTLSLVYRREMLLAEPVRMVMQFVIGVIREHSRLLSGLPEPSSLKRPRAG